MAEVRAVAQHDQPTTVEIPPGHMSYSQRMKKKEEDDRKVLVESIKQAIAESLEEVNEKLDALSSKLDFSTPHTTPEAAREEQPNQPRRK